MSGTFMEIKCVFQVSLSEIYIVRDLSEIVTQMYRCLHVKYLLFLSDFN